MTGNSWDEMRKAKEESYFDKRNREALERMTAFQKEKPRLSPITGEPMNKEIVYGVVIDRCPTSGGVWLDHGELEQLLKVERGFKDGEQVESGTVEGGAQSWVKALLTGFAPKSK